MKKIYLFLLILLTTLQLFGSDHSEKHHIISVTPKPNQINVDKHTSIDIVYDAPLLETSIHQKSIKVKTVDKEMVEGIVSVVGGNTLRFTPLQALKGGELYKVKVKKVKLRSSSRIKKGSKGSYDSKGSHHYIKTEELKFAFHVRLRTLQSIEANATSLQLIEGQVTSLTLRALYDDNSSDIITDLATYKSSDSSVFTVTQGQIYGQVDGHASLSIVYKNKMLTLPVDVYEMIEGHILPHAPQNPDATLLGVDANQNGVRDDVERWIYQEMPTYHHPEIERVIAMQGAKSLQMTLEDPQNNNDKVHQAIVKTADCWSYYSYNRDIPFDGAIEKFNNLLDDKQFNTRERLNTYMNYNATLSGRVFTATPLRLLNTSYCDQNIDVLP